MNSNLIPIYPHQVYTSCRPGLNKDLLCIYNLQNIIFGTKVMLTAIATGTLSEPEVVHLPCMGESWNTIIVHVHVTRQSQCHNACYIQYKIHNP